MPKMIPRKLQQNMINWVMDRCDNREPLQLQEFFAFMKDLGYQLSPAIKKTLSHKMKLKYMNLTAARRQSR